MQEHNIRRTIPLPKNIRYTSFQFYAKSEPGQGISVEQLYIKQILYVLNWIQKRCLNKDNSNHADLPEFLQNIPKPEEYKNYPLEDLASYRYYAGFQIEIMVSRDKKNWAMRVQEIDRGPKPDKPDEARKPVPGRSFITDIGLRRNESSVEIATRTLVDEPEGTKEECDAFRQAFIKELIADKDIKLVNDGWPVREEHIEVKNKDNYKDFMKWLKSDKREALAVVYCASPKVIKVKIKEESEDNTQVHTENKDETNVIDYLDEFKKLALSNRGYAFFYHILPESRRETFLKDIAEINFSNKKTPVLDNEDLFIIGAKKYKTSTVYAYNMNQHCTDDSTKATVIKTIRKYYERKDVSFFGVRFVPELKEVLDREKEETKKSTLDLLEKIDGLEQELHSQKSDYEKNIADLNSEIRRIINQKDKEIQDLKDDLIQQEKDSKSFVESQNRILNEKDYLIERLRNRKKRPKKFEDIPKWVNNSFKDRLIMSERAQKEVNEITKEYDLDNICDALEYLAFEYRDLLRGNISVDMVNNRASKIYDRSYEVTKVDVPGINNKTEYSFKYYKRDGTPCEDEEIDRHLYLNNSNRIYFIYDKEDKRIVIASLPHHLRTKSDR